MMFNFSGREISEKYLKPQIFFQITPPLPGMYYLQKLVSVLQVSHLATLSLMILNTGLYSPLAFLVNNLYCHGSSRLSFSILSMVLTQLFTVYPQDCRIAQLYSISPFFRFRILLFCIFRMSPVLS